MPIVFAVAVLSGCGDSVKSAAPSNPPTQTANQTTAPGGAAGRTDSAQPANPDNAAGKTDPAQTEKPNGSTGKTDATQTGKPDNDSGKNGAAQPAGKGDALQVVAQPDSITVLVNKQFALPKDYEPKDLVYPDVPFTFKEKIEKRMMRKEAAKALEQLFAGAKKDGVALAGVSAYRSYATQTAVFNNYVKKDGEAKARTYSAYPGTSEHETGLAIDISGSDGKCAAADCFAGTKEAKWLDQHAAEYGFIVRYPKGKESITGYSYEPWHIRYVGTKISKEIADKGITLEEYLNAVPVSR